jgi:hypothetical protein
MKSKEQITVTQQHRQKHLEMRFFLLPRQEMNVINGSQNITHSTKKESHVPKPKNKYKRNK